MLEDIQMDNETIILKRYYDTVFAKHLEVLNKMQDEIFEPFVKLIAVCVKAIQRRNKLLIFRQRR